MLNLGGHQIGTGLLGRLTCQWCVPCITTLFGRWWLTASALLAANLQDTQEQFLSLVEKQLEADVFPNVNSKQCIYLDYQHCNIEKFLHQFGWYSIQYLMGYLGYEPLTSRCGKSTVVRPGGRATAFRPMERLRLLAMSVYFKDPRVEMGRVLIDSLISAQRFEARVKYIENPWSLGGKFWRSRPHVCIQEAWVLEHLSTCQLRKSKLGRIHRERMPEKKLETACVLTKYQRWLP